MKAEYVDMVSKAFRCGIIQLNKALRCCAMAEHLCQRGTRFTKYSNFFALQKYIFVRGSHSRKALLHPASRLDSSFKLFDAGWSSPVARQAHNLKVVSSNLAPATNKKPVISMR